MSGKKNNTKQLRKEAQRNAPVHWEQDWIDQVLDSIRDFASQSVRLRFYRDIEVADRANWTFGSDIDVEHDRRRIIVTEWFVPVVDGKPVVYLDDAHTQLNPDMQAFKFILRYDHLQQAAKDAHQRRTNPNIGLYYLPEVTLLPGEKGWEARLENIDRIGRKLVQEAVDFLTAKKAMLEAEYGKESDDGIYLGATLAYNEDENLLQVVTHKRGPLDVIENKDGEVNYEDIQSIDIASTYPADDAAGNNVRSAVARHAAEHRDWKRVVKPSQAAYKRFSGDLADYLMSISEEVYKRAQAAAPADAKVDFEYNLMNGGLEASYQKVLTEDDVAEAKDADGQTGDVGVKGKFAGDKAKVTIELAREDRAAIILVAGRIEPDMWFHVQADYLARFLGTYGNGQTTVSKEVLGTA